MRNSDENNGRLTGIRREVKYLLDPATGKKALAKLGERLSPKIVNGEPSSFRVSIYLDTPDRVFSKAELKNDQLSTKIRLRDYYRLEGVSPDFGDDCFVEVKIRFGQMVEKSRFTVVRDAVRETLKNGPTLSEDPVTRAAHEAFEATRQGKPLEPLFAVHYRRYTLQDNNDRLRITFDDMVSFHVAGKDTLDTSKCSRSDLPPPLLVEPSWIVEVKSLGASPLWVEEILDAKRQSPYSKFATGVRELERRGLLFPKP
jgi:hypothetical protein